MMRVIFQIDLNCVYRSVLVLYFVSLCRALQNAAKSLKNTV